MAKKGKTFEITTKQAFHFDFTVNGKKKRETIYIDMSDPGIADRLMNVQNSLENRLNSIKIDDITVDTSKFPDKFDSFDDIASLSSEQISELKKLSDETSKIESQFENAIIDEISLALNTDVSPVFKYCSPMYIIGKEYFFTMFLEELGNKMVEYLNENATKKVDYSKKSYMKGYIK